MITEEERQAALADPESVDFTTWCRLLPGHCLVCHKEGLDDTTPELECCVQVSEGHHKAAARG